MKLVNTLTRQEEEFVPLGDTVRMYVCGVTPYDENHVGHAMSYIVFDVLRRYLEHLGYRVRHVQNFTDIDDRIIARAARLGIDEAELAQRFIDRYFEDMRALNILPAHEYPRATQEIPEMIRLIDGLIEKGYAYAAPPSEGSEHGDVYYRVKSKHDYGKLSKRNLDDMVAGARVEPGEGKENPLDFALWKGAKPGEPAWESPWGLGRPGWHIECSAMSLKYLGEQIDIHGGGEDLIFPHHENEIAQTEAFTGEEPFVRYWLHNAWVRMGEEKMSKSLGNFVPVREAVQRWGADAVRLFVLTSHYRSPLTYSEEALDAAKRGAERLRTSLTDAPGAMPAAGSTDPTPAGAAPAALPVRQAGLEASPFRERFIEAMDRDLNTPQAVAAIFDLAREINRARDEGLGVEGAQVILREMAGVLGLTLVQEEEPLAAAPFVQLLIDIRQELRQAKRYDLADVIRSRLAELGIALEDTAQGTVWKRRD